MSLAGSWEFPGGKREKDETPSFFGRYDKVLAQGSMSKAYGLPGLRVGWTVGPADAVAPEPRARRSKEMMGWRLPSPAWNTLARVRP